MAEQELTCAYSDLPSPMAYLALQEKEEPGKLPLHPFSARDTDRIIEMAWEDRTPFEAIKYQFGLSEKEVVMFMRQHSLPSSFTMWRKRVKSRKTKHSALRNRAIGRFKCNRQRGTGNKISKR
jgi:uncharacterized protein (TIGR03643 family)